MCTERLMSSETSAPCTGATSPDNAGLRYRNVYNTLRSTRETAPAFDTHETACFATARFPRCLFFLLSNVNRRLFTAALFFQRPVDGVL